MSTPPPAPLLWRRRVTARPRSISDSVLRYVSPRAPLFPWPFFHAPHFYAPPLPLHAPPPTAQTASPTPTLNGQADDKSANGQADDEAPPTVQTPASPTPTLNGHADDEAPLMVSASSTPTLNANGTAAGAVLARQAVWESALPGTEKYAEPRDTCTPTRFHRVLAARPSHPVR
jgi:hypothetical protein